MMHLYVDVSPLCHALANRDPNLSAATIAVEVMSMIAGFIRYHKATRTYFCLDHPIGNWRKSVCPSYKEGRRDDLDPAELRVREIATEAATVLVPELVDLMILPRFQKEWIEADDWAAACIAINEGRSGVIIGSDKDFWQMLNPQVSMVNPIHNYRVIVGESGTIQKIKADNAVEDEQLTPSQYLLSKAIIGDTSDNLPGLSGVGPKGAVKAILSGSVPALITENTKEVTPRKSKRNPDPQSYYQDARAVIEHNLRMMSLLRSEVSEKVKCLASWLQAQGIRGKQNNFTKLTIWLEEHGISNPEIARSLIPEYTNQWTM